MQQGDWRSLESCIPIIPSADLEKSLRLWVNGFGFRVDSEMREDGKLVFCILRGNGLAFMLNQRAGTPIKPEDYEGIRLYWAPSDIRETRERLKRLGYNVSDLEERDYGQTEFFLTDDDGYSHCFGVRPELYSAIPSGWHLAFAFSRWWRGLTDDSLSAVRRRGSWASRYGRPESAG